MSHTIDAPASAAPPRSAEQDLALKLWVVLSRAYTSMQRLTEADIARHDLSPGEFAILETLYHKGPLLLGEVQKKILVSSGGVTYLVDRLVAQGLVERRECASDRRARYAALTPAGEAMMHRVFPEHAAEVEGAMNALSTAEKRTVIGLLKKLGLSITEKST
jgi:MarR family 2-MHQ and catechol resistance regulon transcriptional repressor